MTSIFKALADYNKVNSIDHTSVNEDNLLNELIQNQYDTVESNAEIPRFYYTKPDIQPSLSSTATPSLNTQYLRYIQLQSLQCQSSYILNELQLTQLWYSLNQYSTPDIQTTLSRRNSLQSSIHSNIDDLGNSVDDHSTHNNQYSSNDNTQSNKNDHKKINYCDLMACIHSLSEDIQKCIYEQHTRNLCALYNQFPHDNELYRISVHQCFYYIYECNVTYQLQLNLQCYDDSGTGILTEHNLENYIFDQISTQSYTQLCTLETEFYPYYVFTVCSKLMFMADIHKLNKISVQYLANSTMLHEFHELKYSMNQRKFPLIHHTNTNTQRMKNWFSLAWCHQLYSLYLSLDINQNGMLDLNEFSRFNGGSLTTLFTTQLYNTYRMYATPTIDPHTNQCTNVMEMDYKTFLEFMLALEYKQTPASITYFYKILISLNISTAYHTNNHNNVLTSTTIKQWFTAVRSKLLSLGHSAPEPDCVVLEIFDMVTPFNPNYITLNDLIHSGVGHTVIQILIDVNGFWRYDNRETLMHQQQSEDTL